VVAKEIFITDSGKKRRMLKRKDSKPVEANGVCKPGVGLREKKGTASGFQIASSKRVVGAHQHACST